MDRAWLAVPLIALAACGSLELRPDDASAAEWEPSGNSGLFASKRGVHWTGGSLRLEGGGRFNFEPGEFPVALHVKNDSSEDVTLRIRHAVSDGSAVIGDKEWQGRSRFLSSIVDGEPFTLPGSSIDLLRLRADRAWTPDEPMRDGDTVSYDVEITSASGTTTCRLRMVIARRWSDTFDEWWQPIVCVPLLPVGVVWYGILFIVTGGDIVNILR
jgi:hypothetical protein